MAMLRPPVVSRLRARPPSGPRRRCSCSRCSGRSRPEIAVRISCLGGVAGSRSSSAAGRHQHPGRAEPAVQRVQLVEALLDRVEPAVDLERLDRADLVALAHRRQDRARLHRLAVHQHHAGAAVGRVAAPVRAGQARRVADEVDEQLARLDVARDLLAVDRDRQFHVRPPDARARAVARRSARVVSTPARWRL